MEHYKFEFWILVGFESWSCDLGLPKDGSCGENNFIIRHKFFGSKYSYKYFVVENHNFFCYTTNFILVFGIHLNRGWNFAIILIEFLIKQRNTYFCIDFHIHIVVWIFYNIKKCNEMNCNIVSEFFYIIIYNADFGYMK
jgi:hypothetical protein